jgi:hypothetical protein
MTKKKTTEKPVEIPLPEKQPEIKQPIDPEEPIVPGEDPDKVPYESPFETPPYEIPPRMRAGK